MSGFLVDSHVYLWMLIDPSLIGESAMRSLQNHPVAVSVASMWELCLDIDKGKLAMDRQDVLRGYELLGIAVFDITAHDVARLDEVSLNHRDSFDQLLCGRALSRGYTLLTADSQILASFNPSQNATL